VTTELDLELSGNDMDLIDSKLLFDPVTKVKVALGLFDFLPIKKSMLSETI
jgi:hypothetical protein